MKKKLLTLALALSLLLPAGNVFAVQAFNNNTELGHFSKINCGTTVTCSQSSGQLLIESTGASGSQTITGAEGAEAALILLADQDDDATDGWEIAASITGTWTLGNDSSVAGTYVDKLTVDGATGNLTLTGDIINENADTLIMSTDDLLRFASNDEASVIEAFGFEGKTASLILTADEDDDATDSYRLQANLTGSLLVQSDQSVAGTYVTIWDVSGVNGNVNMTGDLFNENADSIKMDTDDSFVFTSNDEIATVEVRGFEAKDAVVMLSADEGDDNGDSWQIVSAVSGNNFLVQNDTSGSMATKFSVNTAGTVSIIGGLLGGIDAITADTAGTAASVATLITEVTTDGDSNEDNVTLANGTVGQVKIIVNTVEGAGGDTWKITPATFGSGTSIGFDGVVGDSATFVYTSAIGWILVSHNGGTVS